jgi:hypothetical protein
MGPGQENLGGWNGIVVVVYDDPAQLMITPIKHESDIEITPGSETQAPDQD